ncbi:hypothetical protein AYI68_g7682 [Smittium mucronatum]|uniref:Enhancer of mRNA-decapping protein 3 n=1 Tax=Smittium mucronatum TaxID=133383 RepID=A0A1R0GMZ9_9FUNG|nr:hypothetical protein AYI68_g7682 [Smittium mucronatum]
MEDFIGSPVKITFNRPDIQYACGVISAIRAETQMLTIDNAIVLFKGQKIRLNKYNIFGNIIRDIQMLTSSHLDSLSSDPSVDLNPDLSNTAYYSELLPGNVPDVLPPSSTSSSNRPSPRAGNIDHSRKPPTSFQPPPAAKQVSSPNYPNDPALLVVNSLKIAPIQNNDQVSAAHLFSLFPNNSSEPRNEKNQSPNPSQTQFSHSNSSTLKPPSSTKKNRKPFNQSKATLENDVNSWAAQDVAHYNANEFDFQANLKLFDKSKVFHDIRSKDIKDPKLLLVNINRLEKPNPTPSQTFSPQTTLSSNPNPSNIKSSKKPQSSKDTFIRNDPLSKNHFFKKDSATPSNMPLSSMDPNNVHSLLSKDLHELFVSPFQWAEMENMLTRDLGISESSLVDVAGKVASNMAISILKSLENSSNNSPEIIIFIGNGRSGLYGLSAARFLLNSGCSVSIFLTFPEHQAHYLILKYINLVKLSNGVVLKSLDMCSLDSNFDLVVDSIFSPNDIRLIENLPSPHCSNEELLSSVGLLGSKHAVRAASWYDSKRASNLPLLILDFPSLFLLSVSDSIKPHIAIASNNSRRKSKSKNKQLLNTDLEINNVSKKCLQNGNGIFQNAANSPHSGGNSGYSSESDDTSVRNRIRTKPKLRKLAPSVVCLSFGLPSVYLLRNKSLVGGRILVADIGIPIPVWSKVINFDDPRSCSIQSLFLGSDMPAIDLEF